MSDWLGGGSSQGILPVAPELEKMKGMKVLCLYGKEEQESLCREQTPDGLQMLRLAQGGGHHFGGAYEKLAEVILTETLAK